MTQECTHDCIFCHGEGLGLHLKKKEILVADDIDFIFNVGRLYFGFEHTTLTGKVFHKIIYGLEQFRSKFANVKIRLNVTLVKGVNDNEKNINELINFASRLNASIKFIEFC